MLVIDVYIVVVAVAIVAVLAENWCLKTSR